MTHEQGLRDALIRTTVALLREQAPSEISLRSVARALGVSSGAPYHHFEDRSALFAAVALEGWRELLASMTAVAPAPADQMLRALARSYLTFALARPEHYRCMFLSELKDPERFPELHAASTGSLAILSSLVAQSRESAVDDPDVIMRVVGSWSAVHGFALLYSGRVLEGKIGVLGDEALLEGIIEAAVRAALG